MTPARIGRFEVLEELGRGGMGVVYRAWDPVLARPVAIKKLSSMTEEHLGRFRQEALASARLHHPNLSTVHECGDEGGEPYLVMEFLDGQSLKALIRSGSLPELPERLRIVAEVARGLDHAHAQGIAAHRDVKPANIQVTACGTAKVMDFGIAKLADELRLAATLTQANTVLGTLFYMSPEQVRGEKLDGRSDVWSLGVVLHEIVFGTRPFDDPDDNEVMKKIVLDDLPDPPHLGVHEEDELRRIVRRALEKDRERRYGSAGALAADLEACRRAMIERRAEPVVRREPSAEEYFEAGRALYAEGHYARAAGMFRHALALAPRSLPARRNLELAEAARNRKHADELYKLGLLLFRNREYPVAISAFEELLRLEPEHDDARTLIVWARREQTRHRDKEGFDRMVEDTLEELLERGEALDERSTEDSPSLLTAGGSFSPPSTGPAAGTPAAAAAAPAPAPPPAPEPVAVPARDRSTSRITSWLRRLLRS